MVSRIIMSRAVRFLIIFSHGFGRRFPSFKGLCTRHSLRFLLKVALNYLRSLKREVVGVASWTLSSKLLVSCTNSMLGVDASELVKLIVLHLIATLIGV